MKNHILILMFAALSCLLSGCVDDSYRGLVDVSTLEDNSTMMPVWMFVGDPTEIVDPATIKTTKGTGLISGAESFSEKSFYVYAFNHQDSFTSMTTKAVEDSLRCLIDGSIDDPETLAGREATWSTIYERVNWENGDDIYWPTGDGRGNIYDFFAYFVDDMELTNSNYRRMDDKVVVDIEIDGSQDIMSAKAKTPEEKLLELFPEEKDRIYMQYYCYSYHSAINDIHPEFVFKHHLVKFDFKAVPGLTLGKNKTVTIKKVELKSRYKAEFTVADTAEPSQVGLVFKDDYKDMELTESDGSPLLEDYVVTTLSREDMTAEGITIGGSLLVAPGTQYIMTISLSEVHDGLELPPHEAEITLYQGNKADPIPFTAGNEYMVTMTIFGQMDLDVSTELGKWEDGGEAETETEQRPGTQT